MPYIWVPIYRYTVPLEKVIENIHNQQINKDGNRIYEYSIKPPNPHNFDFKRALSRVNK